MRQAFALLLLLAGYADAIVVDRVNDTTGLDYEPTTNVVIMRHGDWFRYRVQAVQGTNVLPYTGATGCTGLLYDVRLGDVAARATGLVNSADAATFTIYATPGAVLETGAWYRLKAIVYGPAGAIGTVIHDPVMMEGVSQAGSAGVTVINNNNVTNQLDNITSTIENHYTSGVSSVLGATGAVALVSGDGSIDFTVSNNTINMRGAASGQAAWTNVQDGGGAALTNSDIYAQTFLLLGGSTLGAGWTNLIVGGSGNVLSNNVRYSVVLGNAHNVGASASSSAILGGSNNWIRMGTFAGVVAGGYKNDVGYNGTYYGAIGGGYANRAAGTASTISGGFGNSNSVAGSDYVAIIGGYHNRADADFAVALGGSSNSAFAIGSVVAGVRSIAASTATNSWTYNGDPSIAFTNDFAKSAVWNVPGGFTIVSSNAAGAVSTYTFTPTGAVWQVNVTNIYLFGPQGPTFNGGNFP